MNEVVLDGGGRFSPASIVGVHTLSLLLSPQAAHDRAAELSALICVIPRGKDLIPPCLDYFI